ANISSTDTGTILRCRIRAYCGTGLLAWCFKANHYFENKQFLTTKVSFKDGGDSRRLFVITHFCLPYGNGNFAEKQIFIFSAYFQCISSAAPPPKYNLKEKALRLKSTKNLKKIFFVNILMLHKSVSSYTPTSGYRIKIVAAIHVRQDITCDNPVYTTSARSRMCGVKNYIPWRLEDANEKQCFIW
ncbi:MAG: hypothetical protein KBT13_02485, partial [Bacteroidales bacterium]|nr:hypothetical protein [Candidatus Sodaliphilus limicaballi]